MSTSFNRKIRLAYADDHPLVRQGISNIILDFGCFDIIIQANDGVELIHLLKKSAIVPDICILDISMPYMNGYDTLVSIKKVWQNMKFLILTMFNDEYAVLQALRNGANGYILKNSNPRELKQALLSIHQIGSYHSELTTGYTHNAFHNGGANKLTEREVQFLKLCCSDYHYKDIANQMGVSQRTIEGYRDSLFDKLRIKTRTGLAMYAIRVGLFALSEF